MALTLGPDPDTLTVRLVRGAGWWARLEAVAADGTPLDFEVGDAVTLTVGGADWSAAITGNVAEFNESGAAVDAAVAALEDVPASARPDAFLWFTRDGVRLPWAIGPVTING